MTFRTIAGNLVNPDGSDADGALLLTAKKNTAGTDGVPRETAQTITVASGAYTDEVELGTYRIAFTPTGGDAINLGVAVIPAGPSTDLLTLISTSVIPDGTDVTLDSLSVAALTVSGSATFFGATIADLGTVSAATSITTSALVAATADIDAGTWQGTIDGAWTAAAQTCADLGAVTTADINGGTWQGTIDGPWTALSQTCANLGTVSAATSITTSALVAATADINGGTWQGTIDGPWTALSQTCANLGTVSAATSITTSALVAATADINGGTWQGTIDGPWTAAGQTCADLGTVTTATSITTDYLKSDDNVLDGSGLTKSVTDSLLSLAGGSSSANMSLYGGTHATQAGNIFFSANKHTFRSQDGVTTHLVVDDAGDQILLSSSLRNTGANALAAGDWSASFLGADGAARDVFRAGITTVSNGFTVKYNGTDMVYQFQSGGVTVLTSPAGVDANLEIADTTLPNIILQDSGASTVTDSQGKISFERNADVEFGNIRTDSGDIILKIATSFSTGEIALHTGSDVEAVRIDSAGNLGLGITPESGWASTFTAAQIGGNGAIWCATTQDENGNFSLSENLYYDGSYRGLVTDSLGASQIQFVGGEILFRTSNGGVTADVAFAPLTALTIANDGTVGVGVGGVTGLGNLGVRSLDTVMDDITDGSASTLFLGDVSAGVGLGNYTASLWFSGTETLRPHAGIRGKQTTSDEDNIGLAFWVHPSISNGAVPEEKMVLDHSGNLGIGGGVTGLGNLGVRSLDTVMDDITDGSASTLFLGDVSAGVGLGNYTASLWFSGTETLRPHAGIRGKQTTSDEDNIGLAFWVHPSISNGAVPEEKMVLDHSGNLGIGLTPTSNMDGLSIEAGVLTLKETTTPTADTNYGKIYAKNDNKLYFQDGAGTEHEVSLI